jgi:hypothetical protein
MINRRNLLLSSPVLLVPSLAKSAPPLDLGDAAALRRGAELFLSKLAPEQAADASFPFGGTVQKRWNFMGTGGFIKPGLRLENMQSDLKAAAWNMLAQVLSPRGLTKARDVMILQQVLIDQGNSPTARHPERYSLAFFGAPAAASTWALRFEGHHLSLTFTVANDRLTGITPSSFSVNPNRVGAGFKNGLVTLKREDDLARRLAKDLSGTGAGKAFFRETPFANIRATAGNETPFKTYEGLAVADMKSPQRELFAALVDAYTAEHLTSPHATAVAAYLKDETTSAAHFAFAGSHTVGERAYYRIHGPRMLIEFAAVDDKAQHLHTIFHLG